MWELGVNTLTLFREIYEDMYVHYIMGTSRLLCDLIANALCSRSVLVVIIIVLPLYGGNINEQVELLEHIPA